jgi:penicillin-binding protein 1C
MGVVAAVGSASFHDDSIAGQVNGTLAKRSPGSRKPFIYALAMDRDCPPVILKDAAVAGPTAPRTDGRFAGPSALRTRSSLRNVPGGGLSARLAQPSLCQFLRSAAFRRVSALWTGTRARRWRSDHGRAATLYAMLANEGRLRPLRPVADEPIDSEPTCYRAGKFLDDQMLEQNPDG